MRRLLFLAIMIGATSQVLAQKGFVEHHQLFSPALEGNHIGDSPTRAVSVYLPAQYGASDDQRFPVLYFLHGYTDSNHKWFGEKDHWIDLPAILDSSLALVDQQFIVVMPNAYNTFKGSMYTNSSTTGNWEDFVAEDLVNFMDTTYRTIPEREQRGLAGHSMGGYGTIKIGMKRTDVFGALYLMSPCCLENNMPNNTGLLKNLQKVTAKDQIEEQPFFVSASLAGAAAWAPNPNNPPLFLDLPMGDEIDPQLLTRFKAHEIVPNLAAYQMDLQELLGMRLDVGKQDFMILLGSKSLHEELDRLGVGHGFEMYDGDHVNRIGARIASHVVPFFADVFDK